MANCISKKKMDKKTEMEKLKQERAAERERKKEEKSNLKIKKQKWYEEPDSDLSIFTPELSNGEDSDWYKDSSNEDTNTLGKNDFVIVE